MRITCPECFAQFDVPDGAIKETGRKLRCGQCKHQWHQLPIQDEPTEIIDPPTEELEPKISETYNEFETPPIPKKSDIKASAYIKTKSLPIGAIILTTLIITGIFGFIYGRSDIVAYAPASSILYDKIGFHVPVPGEFLVIKNVGVWRENRGGMEVLAVKGELFNPNEKTQEVPIIKGSEVDATGRVLATESFVPEAATLLPNETIKFEYQTPFPDEKTVSVIVTFSDEKRSGQYGY
tara:strand:- start:496 stop:1206 length:711 start_codon:yes stop_codon:yes gene_type:complete